MTKKCQIDTKKSILSGNNVSHSNRKTKRRFEINIQNYSLMSKILGHFIKFRATASSIRSIDYHHGLDNFLLQTSDKQLSSKAIKVKKRIKKALKKKQEY